MTVQDLVKYLRLSVKVQDPEGTVTTSSKYLEMSDEDLELYLNVVLTRDFPNVRSLEYITSDMIYPLTLLAKKELYYALAVQYAPLYGMVADNNNQLQRGQMFDHIMELIKQTDDEYNQYVEDGGAGGNTLKSYDVLSSNRYFTKRNIDKAVPPALSVYADSVGTNDVCISWDCQVQRFLRFDIYLSTEGPIFDDYQVSNKISEEAKLIATIRDAHQNKVRVSGLSEDSTYYVLVKVTDLSGLKGYSEITIHTDTTEEVTDTDETTYSVEGV